MSGWPEPPPPPGQPPSGPWRAPNQQYPPPGAYGWAPPPLPKGGSARTGPLPLHPMNTSDVLDGAFKLLKANFATIAVVAATFIVPLQLVGAFLRRDALGGEGILTAFRHPETAQATPTDAQFIAGLVVTGITLLITPFVAGAIARVVSASYLGRQETPGPALAAAFGRFFPLLVSWICVHVIEGVGAVFCLLPGLLAMAMFVLTAPAIVVERLGPVQGMRRSWRLVKGRVWPTLGITLLAGLLAYLLSTFLGSPFEIVGLIVGLHWGWIIVGVGSVLSSLISTSIVAIVATLLYFDARIRNEGFDLQVIAAALGDGDAPR